MAQMERINAEKEQGVYDETLAGVEESSIPFPGEYDMGNVRDWVSLSERRGQYSDDARYRMTPAERQLTAALSQPLAVDFDNVPLAQAMEYLAQLADVSIHIDPVGLAAEGVGSNDPVTLQLGDKEIMLKSVLNLLLGPKRLSYVIQDEVLLITSEQARDVKIQTRVYKVADLVIPIPNFSPGANQGLEGSLANAIAAANRGQHGLPGHAPHAPGRYGHAFAHQRAGELQPGWSA